MFSIEATNDRKWRWIAGVFEHRAAAEAFLASVPEAARAMQCIVEFPVSRYPVFVIEDQGFEYGDIHFVKARLKGLVPRGDDDHVHLNVYAICEDFAPTRPGTDGMGGLLHWHVTDDALTSPRAEVFHEDLEEIARGA